MLQALTADPSASINAALGGWNETHAAYRFFDNDNVDAKEILAPHQEATETRIDDEELVTIRKVELPRTPKRAARTAQLEVRAKTVTVKPPNMRESMGTAECDISCAFPNSHESGYPKIES